MLVGLQRGTCSHL